MRHTARNVIPGTVVEVKKGATTALGRIDVGNGVVLTAAMTNEAVEEPGLVPGMKPSAVVKASDVMVGVD